MIQPNRLRNPGEAAALDRIEGLLERIDALGPAILVAQVPRLDREAREIALNEVEQIAAVHGRTPLLDEARGRVRDALLRQTTTRPPSFVDGYSPISSGPPGDQVARTVAIADAVATAVVEDLLDPAVAATLSTPGRLVLGLDPLDAPSADGAGAASAEEAASGTGDTAGAADPAEELERTEAEAALRQRRAAVFVIVAAIALPAAYAAGFGVPAIVVIGLAVCLVAWLFA